MPEAADPDAGGPAAWRRRGLGYMVARAASGDRLLSHEQARRFALAYAGLTLLGLALAVPYWRLLGLL